MTKYEKWQALKDQAKQAKNERDELEKAITTCDWNNSEKSCIKVIQIQSLGVPVENHSSAEFSTQYCNDFCRIHTCTDITCPFRDANAKYVLANLKFRAIRADRRKAFKEMFIRSK